MLRYSRGAVVVVQLDKAGVGREQSRMCVVVQNDAGNEESPLTLVVPVREHASHLSDTLVEVTPADVGFQLRGVIDCAHIMMIPGARIVDVKGKISDAKLAAVGEALKWVFGIR